MSNTYTDRLKKRLVGVGDINWDDETHDNEKIDEFVDSGMLSGNKILSGGIVTVDTGLTVDYTAIESWFSGESLSIVAGSFLLTGAQPGFNTINWIYIDSVGTIQASTVLPTGVFCPIAFVDVSDTAVLRIADVRPMDKAEKDVSGGIPGLTLMKINFMNALGTVKSFFTNSNTAERTYTFPDQSGNIALDINTIGFKNKLINGGFTIWQRGSSQTTSGYGSDDRWSNNNTGSTKTHSIGYFPLGQTDVLGDPRYYSRTVVSSVAGANNYVTKTQKIEFVDKHVGKYVLSFWAKADSPKQMNVHFDQYFGTGGSPSSSVLGIGTQNISLTASWQKFEIPFTIPSVSGKTLGTNNDSSLALIFGFDIGSTYGATFANLGQQSGTFDIAQVQFEKGESSTEFEERPYFIEELLCFRYYEEKANSLIGLMTFYTTAYARTNTMMFKAVKRVTPTMAMGALTPTGHVGTPGTLNTITARVDHFTLIYNWTSGVIGHCFMFSLASWTADSEL